MRRAAGILILLFLGAGLALRADHPFSAADWAIEAEPFFDNPLVLLAPKAFRAPAGSFGLRDLAHERILLREPGSGTRMAVDEYLARHRLRLPRRMTLGSNEAIKEAVAGGLGLTILSRHALTKADLAELRVLPARDFPLHGVWHIVHWQGKHLSAVAEAFRLFLREFAAERQSAAKQRA